MTPPPRPRNFHFLLLMLLLVTTVKGLSLTDRDAEEDKLPVCNRCKCQKKMQPNFIDCSDMGLTHVLDLTAMGGTKDTLLDLDFSNNKITEVPKFPALAVWQLSLSRNQIAHLSNDSFLDLTLISYLDLSYNSLSVDTLTREAFRGNYNQVSYEPLSLAELNLGHNHLTEIERTTFEHLTNLEVLILDGNPLTKLTEQTTAALSSLPKLHTLSLKDVGLKQLPSEGFLLPFPLLRNLNLGDNLMTTVPTGALANTKVLKELTLDGNNIKVLDKHSFPKLDKLEVLNINKMTLRQVLDGSFEHLTSLTTLSMSGNSMLYFLHPDAFEGLPAENFTLRNLLLSNNSLHYLSQHLMPDFAKWKDLEVVDLQGNPWECDCHNEWLITYLMQQVMDRTPELTRNIVCDGPKLMKGKKLAAVGLEHNVSLPCDSKHDFNPNRDNFGLPPGASAGYGYSRSASDRLALGVAVACLMSVVGAACFVGGLYMQRRRQNKYRALHNVRFSGGTGPSTTISGSSDVYRDGQEEDINREDIVRRLGGLS